MTSLTNLLLLIFFLFFVNLFTSCNSLPRYIQGNTTGFAYLPKPKLTDTSGYSFHLSGTYYSDFQEGTEFNSFSFAQEMFSFNKIYEDHFFSFAVGPYTGSYFVRQLDSLQGEKSFFGYSMLFEVAGRTRYRDSEIRFPGVKLAFINEFGEYAAFRREDAKEKLLIDLNRRKYSVSVGLTFEGEAYAGNNISVGVGFMLPGFVVTSETARFQAGGILFGRIKNLTWFFQGNLDVPLSAQLSAGLAVEFPGFRNKKGKL